jgi:hypothetical protein
MNLIISKLHRDFTLQLIACNEDEQKFLESNIGEIVELSRGNETQIELWQEQADAWKTVFYLCERLGMETNVTGKSGLALVTAFVQRNAAQQSMHPTSGSLRGLLAWLWLRVLSALKHFTSPPTRG